MGLDNAFIKEFKKDIPQEGEKNTKEFKKAIPRKQEGKKNPDSESTTEQTVKNYFKNLYNTLHSLYPELFESIRRYKSDAYFYDVNNLKRMGVDGFHAMLKKAGKTPEEIKQRTEASQSIIDDLIKFLENSRLPQEISVYRKITERTLDRIKSQNESFNDQGFVSTSFALKDANKYHKPTCVKIVIPAGTKVIDMTSALLFTNWSNSSEWENELVIGDNYNFEIKPTDSEKYDLILIVKNK
jgi:hypothetical protein